MYCGRAARTACTRRSTTANALASLKSTMPTECVSGCLFLNRYRSSSLYSSMNSRRAGMPRSTAILLTAASL